MNGTESRKKLRERIARQETEIERIRMEVGSICNVALSIAAGITDPVARQTFRNIKGVLEQKETGK